MIKYSDKHGFTRISIKTKYAKKLSKLAKKERRSLSVMIDILIENFEGLK